MKLKIINLAAIMLCCSAQASVQVQNSRGEPVGAPAQSVQQSSVQDLKQQAGQWGLSQDDYERYQSLMNGPRGIQSPGLDPLSTLGIEARSQAERRQYAEKWVKEEDRVRSRQITLNHDGGRWMRFGNGIMPVVLQQGEDGWQLAAF